MPYKFDTGDVEVIDLLDSSEDEDSVVAPTSRRRPLRTGNDSSKTAEESTDTEQSLESSIDEVDKLQAGKRTARPRLRQGATLKLKREVEDLQITEDDVEPDSDPTDVLEAPKGNARCREAFRRVLESMEAAEDIVHLYPKSLHPKFQHTEALSDEREVLLDFVSDDVAADEEDDVFGELEMHDFSIYRGILHEKGFPGQFESLHVVSSEHADGFFYLDGTICHGGQERRIIGAVIHDVNIGGLLDTSTHTSAHHIWVQTKKSRRRHQCWYRLTVPSVEYSATWNDFLWLADLNKHIIDYLTDASTRCEKIHLRHFETAFWKNLLAWHESNEDFDAWSECCARVTDFRMYVTIHANFLRDQAFSISGEEGFASQILDHPVWEGVAAGKFTEDQQSSSHHEQTVVTPNVGSAFTRSFPKWGPGKANFNLLSPVPFSVGVQEQRESRRRRLGLPDKFCAQTSVQVVPDVALLLETAAIANKPTSMAASQLVGKVVVVRPPTMHNTSRDRSHEEQFRFALVHDVAKSSKALKVIWLALPTQTICGSEYDRSFYPIPNELFYTDHCNCRTIPIGRIVHVQDAAVYPKTLWTDDSIIIQLLYREADAAFVTPQKADLICTCQSRTTDDVDHQPAATTSPQQNLRELHNMSLFSGCGLLDYGMESGCHGLIKTTYALDHSEVAICAHAANSTSQNCTHVVGSVNVHLERFLRGEVPLPHIDCITAGCPCKGFSLLNAHRGNEKSQRNCSLLASVLSWIELLLPQLALIENVPRMDFVPKEKTLANACGQAICCLVALGYQVRKVLLPAYEHGSPTLRRRLFLIAAAPGVPLPEVPEPTHGDEADLEPIVTVRDVLKGLTPIHNDTVVNIQDPTHIPIQRQKPIIEMRVSLRNVMKRIPKIPGSGLYQAHQKGLLSKDQNRWYYSTSDEKKDPKSKTLRRVDPNNPFNTIVTVISPLDSRFGGEILHPYEDRLLSLKEIRRAQGVPNNFLLVGTLKNQVELIGNGVAWQVAAALGRSFANAWTEYCERIDDLDEGGDEPRHAEHIVQLPQRMTANFTETQNTECAGAKEEACVPVPIDGVDLQRKLRGMSLEEEGAANLPSGDTIVVKRLPSTSTSPKLEATPDTASQDDRTSHSQKQKVKVSIPPRKFEDTLETKHALPDAHCRSPASSSTATEEVIEVSDHESLVLTPGGTYNYSHRQRGKIIRRSSSTKQAKKPVPMVIIPAKNKRSASPMPPPSMMTQPEASERAVQDERDSDVEYLETRPVAKKKKVTARIEDWYDD